MIEEIKIEDMIYEIRGMQVMLDSDLAKLYQCKNGTKTINQSVKRHINRFPKRFSFKLTIEESDYLVKIFDQKQETRGGKYNCPRVFTEQGVAMLATILKTPVATEISIQIMDAFVMMRKYLSSNSYEKRISNLEVKYIEHDNKFDEVFNKLEKTINNHIFFEGQIYDAYSLMKDFKLNFTPAKQSIIIIDNYIDKKLLDILSKTDKNIIVITNKYNNDDYNKYKQQYTNINIKIDNNFHDRFIIIDDKELYHFGASFKDLGKKCFAITKMEDKEILFNLLNKL